MHPTTSPSEVSQTPVPAGFAPVLPSASPQKALVPAGFAPVLPALLPEKLFQRLQCLLGLVLCNPALPLREHFLRPLCRAGVPLCMPPLPRRISFSRSCLGHFQRASPLRRPRLAPAPGRSEEFASSASPSASRPAHSPEPRALCGRNFCRLVQLFFHGRLNRFSVHVPATRWHVLQLDLREAGAQQLLLSTLANLMPVLVVLAPPCGTASRARDIPAYSNGRRIAKPLRSGQRPDGLPSLQAITLLE